VIVREDAPMPRRYVERAEVEGQPAEWKEAFFAFPAEQWKCLRTTNAIERLNEEFRRRVKTQGSFPTEDAAIVLLYGLVATGQIKLRKIDAPHLVRVVLTKTIALDRAA
jgi:transposase-like protein